MLPVSDFIRLLVHQQLSSNLKDDEPAAWDPSGPIRAALQERMWFLWEHSLARPLLQVLARGKSTREAKADSRRLGTRWKVCLHFFLTCLLIIISDKYLFPFALLPFLWCWLTVVQLSWQLFRLCLLFLPRLQREEEEAYAIRHQRTQSQPAITPFSKFEERKTKEKSSKVNTVTKFFTPSTRTPSKKGTQFEIFNPVVIKVGALCHRMQLFTNIFNNAFYWK